MTAAALTAAQRRFLDEIGPTGREVFAPNVATVRALRARGLVVARFIGMRWWYVAPTPAGRAALAAPAGRP